MKYVILFLMITSSAFGQTSSSLYNDTDSKSYNYSELSRKGYTDAIYSKFARTASKCRSQISSDISDMHRSAKMKGGNSQELYTVSESRSYQGSLSSRIGTGLNDNFQIYFDDSSTKIQYYKITWTAKYAVSFYDPRVSEYRDAQYLGSIERIYNSDCDYVLPEKESIINQDIKDLLSHNLFDVGNCRIKLYSQFSDNQTINGTKKKKEIKLYSELKKQLSDSYFIDSPYHFDYTNNWMYWTPTGKEELAEAGQEANFSIIKYSKKKCEVKLSFDKISSAANFKSKYSSIDKNCNKAMKKFSRQYIENKAFNKCKWSKY
jgi:hypothetical protein